MRRWFIFFAVLGRLGVAVASPADAQVTGVVKSASTGEAIRSAVVTVTGIVAGQKTSRATSGADGRFQISGLPAGQYQLAVWKAGYQASQANTPVTIIPNSSEPANVDLSLWPNGVISGRVVDWEGEPVSAASVNAFAVQYRDTGVLLALKATVETNEAGEYRLFDLPAGKYLVQASPPHGGPSGRFYAFIPVTYFPGVPAPSQALPIDLNSRQEANADLKIPKGQSYGVTGTVWETAEDSSHAGSIVEAIQHDGPYRIALPQTARVSRENTFVLTGLSPGEYTLVLRPGSRKPPLAQASITIRDRHVADVRLEVGSQQVVTGRLVLEDQHEKVDTSGWIAQLNPIGMADKWPEAEGQVEADKQFRMDEVAPARYRFEMSGLPPGAYLRMLRSSGQPLPAPEISVSAGVPAAALEVVVGFDGGVVQGKARTSGDAQPVPARILLMPERGQTAPARTAETGPDGSFSFVSVPPGGYTLYALPAATALQLLDPGVQAALTNYAKPIKVEPKQTVAVEISLAPNIR